MIKKISVMVVFVSIALANNWFNMNPAVHPSARQDGHLVYDSESDRVVLFGGRTTSGASYETWSYDLNNNIWEQMSDAPMTMSFHALVYDSAYDRVIAFYGGVTMAYNFNTDTWEDMIPSPAPAANWGAMMAYDVESSKLILFGGGGGSGGNYFSYRETWTYDYQTNTWTLLDTTGPPCREYGSMVYDSESDLIVLFGGEYDGNQGYLDDTWVYDYNTNTWLEKNPTQHPSARREHGMAYDSERDSVVLYGGDSGPYETWEYDLNTDAWVQITTADLPGASDNVGLTFDSESKRVVLFGGQYLATYFDETWIYPDQEVGIEEYAKVKMRKLTIYPNPFIKSCKISENRSQVEIFDVSGRLINRISGEIWNGEDLNGNVVKSGVYFLKIEGNERIKVIKL